MTEHNRQFDDPEPHVPDRLGRDLRALFQPPNTVPAQVDRAILDKARRRLAKPRRLVIRLRWAAGITAAAAAIVLGIIFFNPQSRLPRVAHNDMVRNLQSRRLAPAEGRADINADGRVDILDAFRLARDIEASGPGLAQWDLNRDGLTDRRDVDVVAFAAVRLDKGV